MAEKGTKQGTASEPRHERTFGPDDHPGIVESVKAWSVELAFMDAADLYPEIASIGLPAIAAAISIDDENPDLEALTNALVKVARELCGGRLRHLLPRVLARTVLVVPGPDGKLTQAKCNTEEGLNLAFRSRKKLFRLLVAWVVGINFADFFDVADLLRFLPTKTKGEGGQSDSSSTSTDDDGEDTSSG